MRRPRKLAAAAVTVMVLAACGGGGGGAATPDGTDDATDVTSNETTPESSSAQGESMADFFGYGEEDQEAAQADYRDQEARIQEEIRRCMAEEGFEYQPMVQPDEAFSVYEEIDQEEWVRTQGFGITTWYGNEEQMDQGSEWIDPNQERLDAMSETESEAWYAALYGTQEEQEEDMTSEIDSETGETFYTGSGFGAGCQGEAMEAEYGEQGDTQALWEEIQPAMDAMYQQVQADPRIVEGNQEWSACMATAGYEVETREDIWETVYADFQARFDEIVGPNGGFADPFEGWTEEEMNAFFEEKTQEEIDAFFEEAQDTSQADIDQEALAALQQEEIDMAVADWECAADLDELFMEVSEEYEVDFVAENRAALEQIREAQGG